MRRRQNEEEKNRQEALRRQHEEAQRLVREEEARKQEEAGRQQQAEALRQQERESKKQLKDEKSRQELDARQEEQRRRGDTQRQRKETEERDGKGTEEATEAKSRMERERRAAAGVIAAFAATDAEVAEERAAALRRSLPLPRQQEELGDPQSDREKSVVQHYDTSRSRGSTRDDFAVQVLQELEPLFKKQPAHTERIARRLLTYLAPHSSLWIRSLSAIGTSLFYKAEYKMALEYFQYAADRCELSSITGNLCADSHLNVAMILCTEFGHYCDSEMHARLALRHFPAHERALWYLILSRIHREDYVAALDIANAAMVVAPSPMLERARIAVLACMGPDDSTKMKIILADFERDSHGISLFTDGRSEFAKTAATLQQALALKRN